MRCRLQTERIQTPIGQSEGGLKPDGRMRIIFFLFQDFCQKNVEHMRPEAVSLLRSSGDSFLHHLVASSPEALFRWGVLRATIRIIAAFKIIGRRRAELCMVHLFLLIYLLIDCADFYFFLTICCFVTLVAARRSSRKSLRDTKRLSSTVDRHSR